MEFGSYNYFNKWLVQYSSTDSIREIKNIVTIHVEINIMKDMIKMFKKNFQQKEVQLNNVNVELNNLVQQIWIRRNTLCSQVWNFSCGHNFLDIFKHYPYITNQIKFHNCQYNATLGERVKDEYIDTADAQNEHVQKLEGEIAILKKKIDTIITSQNTEIIIQNLSIKLRHLKFFSEEIVKFLKYNNQRLYDPKFNKNSEEYKNNNLFINTNKDNNLAFTKENNNTTESDITSTKNKFFLKTQSKILLKFERERCLKKREK